MLKQKIDFGKVKKTIIVGTKKNLMKDAPNIIKEIQDRTRSGKDVNNRSFEPYSDAYAAKKGSKKVDLTVKNHMLANITWKEIKDGIRLYFGSSFEQKKAHGNQVKNGRKFFGTDRRQEKRIAKRLAKLK